MAEEIEVEFTVRASQWLALVSVELHKKAETWNIHEDRSAQKTNRRDDITRDKPK
jgi:hypothetical protein